MPLFRFFLIFALLKFSEKHLILPKIVQNCFSMIHMFRLPNLLSSYSKANRTKLQIMLPKLGHFSQAALIAKNTAAVEAWTKSVFSRIVFVFFLVKKTFSNRQLIFRCCFWSFLVLIQKTSSFL